MAHVRGDDSGNEVAIQRSILEYLAYRGFFVWRTNNLPVFDTRYNRYRAFPKYAMRGLSDLCGVLPDGKFLAIEVKTKKGQASKWQDEFLQQVAAHGGVAFVARSIDDVVLGLADYAVHLADKDKL